MKLTKTLFLVFFGLYLLWLPHRVQRAQSTPPTFKVRIDRAVMIPMRDGMRLSADLIRPDTEGQFPAIVMYQPYRKDDLGRGGVGLPFYFAERGFVAIRIDCRGTGGSEGISTDEYTSLEQQDGYDAIEWISAQPWSNGNVGMYGSSYSGFTGIQVAILNPPHLKAIVAINASDDRYTDDCHYTPGGNMRMYYDAGTYGNSMVAMNALPPLPELTGPNWEKLWRQRLERNEPYLLKWMQHQVDGEYWRNGSLRPEYERIKCPVFLIDGWHDGYVSGMLRMFSHLNVPKKLLIGPWVHSMPHSSIPGPRINWMDDVARFLAHWLRKEDTGVMKEPSVIVYMQQFTAPDRRLNVIPGYWRSEDSFPLANSREVTFYLGENGRLLADPETPKGSESDEHQYVPTIGLANGYWSAGGISYYLPEDQRTDEALSLVYTSEPFKEDTAILGWPKIRLHVSSSAKVTTFVVKLSDVAPDGQSALIVDGSINATRRNSLTTPAPLNPGEIYELSIPVRPTGWVLAGGHKLRLAISSSDFPNLWPTPERATNRIFRSDRYPSSISLPVVPGESSLPSPKFPGPPTLFSIVTSAAGPPVQQVLYDQITGTSTVIRKTNSVTTLDSDLGKISSEAWFQCSASSRDPAHSSVVGFQKYVIERGNESFESSSQTTITASANDFQITIHLIVKRNNLPYFQRTWNVTEPRKLL